MADNRGLLGWCPHYCSSYSQDVKCQREDQNANKREQKDAEAYRTGWTQRAILLALISLFKDSMLYWMHGEHIMMFLETDEMSPLLLGNAESGGEGRGVC